MRTAIIRRHGPPGVLEIVSSEKPSPGPGEALIRTAAMAVSGPDVLMRQGLYKWAPPLPLSPGNEMTGFVEAIGPGVETVELRSAVLLSSRELPSRGGCYTDYRVVPAAALHVLPDGIDLEQVVTVPSYLVAHAMLRVSLSEQARIIFVNGAAGIIGSALVELAKARGLTVIGTVSSEEKARYARAKGVDELIFYKNGSVLDQVLDVTHGAGVDVAFDHVIGPGFIDCVRMLSDFGTAIAYNVHTPMPDQDVFAELRRHSVRSPSVRVFNIHTYDHDVPMLRRMTRELLDMLAAGKIKPVIGTRLPLASVVDAHRLFEQRSILGKIILVP